MSQLTALYDASVLYPSLTRNLLVHLATSGLVAARWSTQIQDEWTRNLLQDRADPRTAGPHPAADGGGAGRRD